MMRGPSAGWAAGAGCGTVGAAPQGVAPHGAALGAAAGRAWPTEENRGPLSAWGAASPTRAKRGLSPLAGAPLAGAGAQGEAARGAGAQGAAAAHGAAPQGDPEGWAACWAGIAAGAPGSGRLCTQ